MLWPLQRLGGNSNGTLRPSGNSYREPGKENMILPNRGTMDLVGAGAIGDLWLNSCSHLGLLDHKGQDST